MNLVGWIVLLTLLADFTLNRIADALNLRAMAEQPPAGFAGVYDPGRYRNSQQYLRVNTRFGWITESVDLGVILAFWFSGGFPALDGWVRGFGYGPVVTGLLFVGALMLLKSLIDLPFSVYHTFAIEERFGFNRTTVKTFIADRLKALALSAALGAPLLAGIIAFFQYGGPHAWLYCWIAAALFTLSIQYIAPTWIMPLFNRFDPLEEGELRRAIFDLAEAAGFPLQNVFVMDGSKRSEKSNAFFTGFGRNRRIALFDTLIARHTVPELVAILAHEIGHYKKRHIQISMGLGILHMGVMFYLLSFFLSYNPLFSAFYMDQPSVYAGLLFFGMLYAPIELFLGILLQMVSRKNEYAADRFAVETTSDGPAMADALKKLSAHNLSNLTPHPFFVFLNYSHPPVVERIEAIRSSFPRSSTATDSPVSFPAGPMDTFH